MVSVRDALALAGTRQSDLAAILQALEDDRIGHTGEDDACGPFTELNPAILSQPPYGLNLKEVQHCQEGCQACTRLVFEMYLRHCWKCTCVILYARRLSRHEHLC